MKVTLKDGSVREFEGLVTALDVTRDISEGLARAACAAMIDGEVSSLTTPIEKDIDEFVVLKFDDEEGRKTYRHTASHILAQAVKRLYPNAKLAIGPAIDNGFYYDFDIDGSFSPEDLKKIEEEMENIISEKLEIKRFELPREEAIKFMQEKGEPYKVELIEDLPEDAVISFYEQGDFVDLCAGPHLPSTDRIKSFKLISAAGAYWRGSEKNKMLQRIYGTAFDNKKDLKEYLNQLEEAKKRDHNKLGRELELFTTVDYIGQGLPILLPKGARIIQLLQRFVEDEEQRRGYMLTKTPMLAKSDLYKISGHWDHYREGMFTMGDEEEGEAFALRPMTCPFQFQVFLNRMRSYRDLPMRLGETSTLFRNEASGEMHGLIRVRQFTISEGHIICTPEQLSGEFAEALKLAKYMLETLGLIDDVHYVFAKWDENNREKYIGSAEAWENTQNNMREILDNLEVDYTEESGEAAFYGPKLDIQIRNVHGKEDTLITIQVDFQLAERFGMEYVDSDGEKKHPIIIHRTSIGCYERTLALLIEKYTGTFPVWLSPTQAKILTITDRSNEFANEVIKILESYSIRCEIDTRNEKVGFKIREARNERVPYIAVIGDMEVEKQNLNVRIRGEKDGIEMTPKELADRIAEDIREKR
jgi:threonyl-tRNA synthetase